MASRFMLSPIVVTNSGAITVQIPKAEQYCDRGCVHFHAISNTTGLSITGWALTLGRSSNWALADADPQVEFLFPIPNTVDTPSELRAFLSSKTIADATAAQRLTLQAILDAHSIDRSDFTLATTALEILKRAIRTLRSAEGRLDDPQYGLGFHF